jgi:serine protease Do
MTSPTRSTRWTLPVAVLLLFACGLFQAQARGLPEFTELVEKYSPAVVNISTTQSQSASDRLGFEHRFQLPDLPKDGPFRDFFRHFFGEDGLEGLEEELPDFDQESLGSGFIISADGYILSNYHVVDGADEVQVRLSDRREFIAKVVGLDRQSDIALLKIEADELPIVKIGKSADLKVGEWVLAIGSPFGFDHSATAGIVSAKGRSLPSENYVPFIQTDVAINPGNSGGPLFNLDGEVVGVNSQIYSRTGGFMGLSFAIPIDVAMHVADQLRSRGRVSRGWLGVLIQDVTRELAESFGMDQPRGALVAKVLPGGPAEAAGIATGDIILEFNGRPVQGSSELPPMVGATKVDENASLLILRKGQRITLAVKIGELPGEDELAAAPSVRKPVGEQFLGLTVEDLSDAQKKELGIKGGVLVRNVEAGPALEAGIRRGDIVQMLNNTPVNGVADFRNLVKDLPAGRTVAVLVHRHSGPIFLAMRLP